MPTYYHGTNSDNAPQIKRKGVCPPNFCRRQGNWPCDTDAVYVTTNFNHAVWFGGFGGLKRPIVYEIQPPTKCTLEHDQEYVTGEGLKVKNCGCVKPTRKCVVTEKLEDAIWGHVTEDEWEQASEGYEFQFPDEGIDAKRATRLCKWVKV